MRERGDGQRGSASVEWTALVLVVSIAFTGFLAVGPSIDGRSFGGFLTIGNPRGGIGSTKIPLDGIEFAAGNLTKLLGLPAAARSPWSLRVPSSLPTVIHRRR